MLGKWVMAKALGRAALEKLLFRGEYSQILDATVDGERGSPVAEALWTVIGALCFRGRVDEAEVFFRKAEKSLDVADRIRCRFFLGISRTRVGQYEEGRAYLGKNLRERESRAVDDGSAFFIYQGLSFYRYFSGKLSTAEKSSARAFEAALRADFLYGRVLSSDIRGHILVQLGDPAAGIETLRQASRFAAKLGNGSIPASIETSILVYESQFGIGNASDTDAVAKLRARLEQVQVQDTYTESTLLLELVRQHSLRGRLAEARATLDRAARLVYSTQNRRHEIVLNLRYAMLAALSGEFPQALSFVRSGKKTLDLRVDGMFEIELLGLEKKTVQALGMEGRADELESLIAQKSLSYGGSVNRRIVERAKPGRRESARRGLDPLGDLLDDVATLSPQEAAERIVEGGYFGLLPSVLALVPSRPVLYLDLKPGTVTALAQGSVVHQEGLTPLLRKFLLEISKRDVGKQELVEKLWGYEYHPLRHDAAVYSAVTALRRLLGDFASWIVTTERGYGFRGDVELRFPATAVAPQDRARIESAPPEDSGLNFRQLKILRELQRSETLSARKVVKLFGVSEITASRDLSLLRDLGHVVRVGRGRATEYALPQKVFHGEATPKSGIKKPKGRKPS